ncbi:MAG: peptidylprolyl isomerase, partial [Bacteroidota bacterium]
SDLFATGATVSFSHIYFSTEKSTDSITKQRALNVLQQLKNSRLQRGPEKGDRFPLQYDYTEQGLLDIEQNFGNKPMADELFKGPLHTWLGPVQSGYGWHLIFITKRNSSAAASFASVKNDVKIKYMEAAKAAENKKLFDKLGEKYIINRAYLSTK